MTWGVRGHIQAEKKARKARINDFKKPAEVIQAALDTFEGGTQGTTQYKGFSIVATADYVKIMHGTSKINEIWDTCKKIEAEPEKYGRPFDGPFKVSFVNNVVYIGTPPS